MELKRHGWADPSTALHEPTRCGPSSGPRAICAQLVEVRDVAEEELQLLRLGVAYVPLTSLPPSRAAPAWSADETDPVLHAFIEGAPEVATQS
ncbi:hypothetical protein [Amycolatopsis sp. FDAARGOS 1241]|uniref:hypothetical protein n=1 Tax=Amycolatopsis sp. FDAARGOS 1241 TaxID=2778070 RepID=UPI0019526703|nr:hypothetical protein [Amycolatopsis sp. FDAARGOS 1241]QRP47831.1 hypothetical protein I6J71_07915 [Amycolatopsis sp. FDAARGOS 1241]